MPDLPAPHAARRTSGRRALGRWMLILLFAIDLISSPLHAHFHDLGPGGGMPHAVLGDHAAGSPQARIIDADDGPRFGHAVAALVPAAPQVLPWQAAGLFARVAAHLRLVGPTELRPAQAWPATRTRPRSRQPPYQRPEGRAPPASHTA